jgi:S-disulfanyl-L-cysteine oxidoreductase SoxD
MRFIFVTMALLGITALGAVGARRASAAEPMKSQWDGVYSLEQAKRGEHLYSENCAACHGSDLNGGEMAPALIGGEFSANWDGLTLGDLFERIRISMPQNDPSALTRAQKIDVLGFILYKGGYPAGQTELPSQTEVLKTISFLATKLDSP